MATNTPAYQLYLANYNAGCEQLGYVPATQTFISLCFTTLLFIIVPRIVPGVTSKPAFILNLIIYLWYVICFIIAVINDYQFYDRRPDYENFARCLLNREYNDKLGLKYAIITIFATKVTASLYIYSGSMAVKVFRGFNLLVSLFGLAAMIARGVAGLGSFFGYSWPFIYCWIVAALGPKLSYSALTSSGWIFIKGFEAVAAAGDDEEQRTAGVQAMALAEFMKAQEDAQTGASSSSSGDENAGEVTVKTGDEQQEQEQEQPGKSFGMSEDGLKEKLTVFSEHFDKSSTLLLFGYVICSYFTVWFLVFSWDWKYGNSDSLNMEYKDSFLAFDSVRPTAPTLYNSKNLGELSNAQLAYVASLFS